jgi:hypothetical protein
MTPREILKAKIAGQSTEMLKEVARALNLKTDRESILVCTWTETELETRLSENDFLDFITEQDKALDNN